MNDLTLLRVFSIRGLTLSGFSLRRYRSAAENIPRRITLQAGQLWCADVLQGTRIACQQGMVWITEVGDYRDHILGPGQLWTPLHGRHIVMQAMSNAIVELEPAQQEQMAKS